MHLIESENIHKFSIAGRRREERLHFQLKTKRFSSSSSISVSKQNACKIKI
jgi:hypothetical protein